MIKKIKGKYVVLSETTGRKLGTYKTKKEALARLRSARLSFSSISKKRKSDKLRMAIGFAPM